MRLTISHLSRQQEGRLLERNSKVANHHLLSPTLMWRYIGRAVTDGEFGVLQSKLNLFQMAPLGPHKPPWGDLRAATVAYRQFKHSTIAPHFYQLFKQKPSGFEILQMNKKMDYSLYHIFPHCLFVFMYFCFRLHVCFDLLPLGVRSFLLGEVLSPNGRRGSGFHSDRTCCHAIGIVIRL